MGPAAEPETSPEAPLPPQGEGAGDDESSPRRDESLSFEATEDAAPTQTAEPATLGKPAAAATWGVTSLVILGLAVVVVAAALAGVLMYAIADDTGRLDRQAQRLDAVTAQIEAQIEAQSSRLDAVEGAVEGAVSGLQTRIGELDGSVGDIQSSAESNSQAVAQMAAAIEDLRGAVNVPADGVAGEAVAQLQETISALAERVASLEQGGEIDDLTGRIARLEEEISGLREQVGATIAQAEAATALGRAYAGLSERVAAGAPFSEDLEAVSAELPGAPGLDVLRPLADDGIPTVSDLQARLAELSAGLPAAGDEETAAADDGFLETMRRRVETMVTVRRADEADWPRALEGAEKALERGDVAGAIAEVEPVSGAAPDEIEAWLTDARARRDAQAALDALSDAVLRQLAGRQ